MHIPSHLKKKGPNNQISESSTYFDLVTNLLFNTQEHTWQVIWSKSVSSSVK